MALGLACCGESTLPLLALQLGLPDGVVSTVGAMNFSCFLVLPLGFVLGGRMGAGKSMRLENFGMALGAAILGFAVWSWVGLFFAGLIAFFVSRAANFAMRFSLQRAIATDEEMPAMLARNYTGMYSCSLLGCLLVSFVLKLFPGANTLALIFLCGAILFALTGNCIGKVGEPGQVQKLAAVPVLPQVRLAWQHKLVRHQIYVGCLHNLILAAVVPINILAAKRGADMSDAAVIMLTAIQSVSAIAGSFVVKSITRKFGPRKMLILGYPLLWIICLWWCLIPENPPFAMLILPFILGGMLMVAFSTSLENYFLISVPTELQLGGTFLVFVVTGGAAGAVGMLLNWTLFKIAPMVIDPAAGAMTTYHFYYTVTGLLFALGIFGAISLPVKFRK